MEQKTITINGLTFIEFISSLRGKRVINKNGQEVPKFILFWSRKTITDILEKYTLIDRE